MQGGDVLVDVGVGGHRVVRMAQDALDIFGGDTSGRQAGGTSVARGMGCQILRQAQGRHAGPPNIAQEGVLIVGLPVRTGEQRACGSGVPGGDDGLNLRVDRDDPVTACIGLDAAGEGLCLWVVGKPGQGAELGDTEAGIAQHKASIPAGGICPVLFQLGKFQIRKGSGFGTFHLRQFYQCGIVAVDDVVLQGVIKKLCEQGFDFGDVGFGQGFDGLAVGVVVQNPAQVGSGDLADQLVGDGGGGAGAYLRPTGGIVGLGLLTDVRERDGFPFLVQLPEGEVILAGGMLQVIVQQGAGIGFAVEAPQLLLDALGVAIDPDIPGRGVDHIFGSVGQFAPDDGTAAVFSFCHDFLLPFRGKSGNMKGQNAPILCFVWWFSGCPSQG